MPPKQNPRLQKIQSLLRRNDWKQAYKEAKFFAKQSADSELPSILVSSLWNWIKDQVRRGQRNEAQSNIRELLQYPDIPDEIRAEFPPVFRALGLNSLLPDELRQDTTLPEIQVELVDLFLVRGEQNTDLLPETLADARRIQDALRQIETKQDETVLELLRPIGFRSPLADWRLFLRGLIDHYHGEDEKAAESWKRLDSKRPPHRIAANLRKLLLAEKFDQQTPAAQGMIAGFFNLFRGPNDSVASRKTELLDTLRSFDQYVKQEKYKELVGRFQTFRSRFRETEPILCERVLRLVHHQLVRNASPEVVRQFVERNLPLPLDPRGHRTYAIVSEHIDDSPFRRPGWLKNPPDYWKEYVEHDIDRIESFSPKMKARAKAVVYDFMASRTIEEFCAARDELGDSDERDIQDAIERTKKEIDDLLEKSVLADPTYSNAYRHQQMFCLESLPEAERKPFHPRLAEINARMLEHIPDQRDALEYLLEFHLDTGNTDAAQSFFERYRELDPLSRKTAFLRHRICLGRIRQGLKQGLKDGDFAEADDGIRELDAVPPLETIMYRFDVLPLALSYINGVLQNPPQRSEGEIGDYVSAAEKRGIEKRLPLLFAVLVEGQALGVPDKILKPLATEWEKAISGRCHGNTAGVLGDLAYNVSISKDRFPQATKIVGEACAFVNRAGQVKWNSEKDLFGACNLLWHLAVEKKDEEYEKTFRSLVKKGLKQFPQSPSFAFFDAETYWLETGRIRWRRSTWAHDSYQEFLKRFGSLRSDPQYAPLIQCAERRIQEIDDDEPEFSPFGTSRGRPVYGDDIGDDEDDFDAFDSAFGLPPGFKFPPELRRQIQRDGGFPPDMVKELEKALPKEMGPFRKLMIETLEECLLHGIPPEQMENVMKRKMQNMSVLDQMKFMAQMARSEFMSEDDELDDEDEDDSGGFLSFFKRKKSTKKNGKGKR